MFKAGANKNDSSIQQEQISQTNIMHPSLKSIIRQNTLQISQRSDEDLLTKVKKSIKAIIKNHSTLRCHICVEQYDPIDVTKLTSSCQHYFCKVCIRQYFIYKINAQEQIRCPQDGCQAKFNKNLDIFEQLPKNLKNKYQQHESFLMKCRNPSLKQCHSVDCKGLFDISKTPCICQICERSYCSKCFYKQHQGQCQNYQIQFLQDFFKFRLCKKCRNVIQKTIGCNHITCICGHQFCYLCGQDWQKDLCRRIPYVVNEVEGQNQNNNRTSRCLEVICITVRVLLYTIYFALGIPIFLVIMVFLFAVYSIVSVFVGGVVLFKNCQQNNYIKILLMPFMMVGGIFWFFYDNLDILVWDYIAKIAIGFFTVFVKVSQLDENDLC